MALPQIHSTLPSAYELYNTYTSERRQSKCNVPPRTCSGVINVVHRNKRTTSLLLSSGAPPYEQLSFKNSDFVRLNPNYFRVEIRRPSCLGSRHDLDRRVVTKSKHDVVLVAIETDALVHISLSGLAQQDAWRLSNRSGA